MSNAKETKNKVVTITAGHSNTDSGAVNKDGDKESVFVTKVRNATLHYLQQHKNITTRTDGYGSTNLPLKEAISLVKGADIAIEYHMNAFTNPSANGVETISLPKHKTLSQNISKAIVGVTGSKLRGDKGWISQEDSARGKLGFVQAGGLIVELGFISNEQENKTLEEKYWLVAKAIYVEICKYLKINPFV